MNPERIFYVYAHYRKSDGRLFYIGKGKGNRHRTKSGRSDYWNRIEAKHGRIARKVFSDMPEPCALSLERALIARHKDLLCNITDGGEGVSGLKHSERTKAKMVANRKPGWIPYWTGKKMPPDMKEKFRAAKLGKHQSPEHAAKSRIAKLGKPQPKSAREATRKLKSRPILNSKGEWFSSATEAAKVLSRRTGKNCSQGNISMAANGHRNFAYGMSWRYCT